MGNKVPDRWENYSNIGSVIKGTRFISFKVPLKNAILNRVVPIALRNWGPADLIATPDLGLVIDLTFTSRYYDHRELENAGIKYVKIMTIGHQIPEARVVKKFTDVVNNYLIKDEDSNGLIGVHCTHGLNRTGYLICRYMIETMKIDPEVAIRDFNAARGHTQERENYLENLRGQLWMKETPPPTSPTAVNTQSYTESSGQMQTPNSESSGAEKHPKKKPEKKKRRRRGDARDYAFGIEQGQSSSRVQWRSDHIQQPLDNRYYDGGGWGYPPNSYYGYHNYQPCWEEGSFYTPFQGAVSGGYRDINGGNQYNGSSNRRGGRYRRGRRRGRD